ncbi:MAG: ATP-dependent Clp protease adaptor ClpS [Myxococcales bacterium]|nr:ATP-dependent Clp protease adaptor ClpS [Myxococcales bacterium]MDD9968327.1 ATP-dependent Clp protease adaptor ClpS [Myxococcales bacterium]
MSDKEETDGSIVTKTRTQAKQRLQKPPLYRVLLHNDDYTTREFVVDVLRQIFRRSQEDAVRIMLHVHHNGVGVAGVYTYEVAEMKVRSVEVLAQQREYPLMLSIEPDDD